MLGFTPRRELAPVISRSSGVASIHMPSPNRISTMASSVPPSMGLRA
jgi:hypothetical protein